MTVTRLLLALFSAFPLSALAQAPFAKTGVAFLEKHCIACHGKEKQKGDLTLHIYRDEASLLKDRKKWKGILDAVKSGDMPPDDEPQPSEAERQAFLATARGVFANFDKNARPDPGRVTVRRLNRTEYNHTVRDLVGMDLQPAADFPSDDVGFGFDNIGDVLSVSPVLMERYLDAAQNIAEQAMPLQLAKPSMSSMGAQYCEPAGPNVQMRGKYRPFTPGKPPIESGPLHTPFRASPTGTYTLRARVYAESPDGKPVKVGLLVSGEKLATPDPADRLAACGASLLPQTKRAKLLGTVEITARDAQHGQTIEATLPPTAGVERMGLAIFHNAGAPAPTVFVEWIQAEGPQDTRSPFVRRWIGPTDGGTPQQRTRALITRLLPRAWRRAVTAEEIEHVAKVSDAALARGETWEGGLRQALTAILASPKFLFRLEADEQPANPEAHPVGEFALASRLSYFLWSSCPDEELLQLASRRQLTTNLDAQIRRMLKDQRAETLVDGFAMQWLQLRRLAGHQADDRTFRNWRSTLKTSMLQETRLFFAEIISADRSILDLLDADYTYLDRRLGELYGITPPGGFQGDEFKRVSLAGTPRGGLLTQASILTVTSNPTRTSPVKRGKWILEQLLGDPPPPPPPNVPSIDDANRKELSGTFRQKMEQHRADPKCANCHAKMDTMGFALENFNGIGQWREKDEQGRPLEIGGKAGGLELRSLDGLKTLLKKDKDQFARCLTEKLLIYALGRGLEYYDDRAVDRIQTDLAKGGYKFSALVSALVQSEPFRFRRGKGQE